jgi:hypothetical protein
MPTNAFQVAIIAIYGSGFIFEVAEVVGTGVVV